jgi:hypothetical protein
MAKLVFGMMQSLDGYVDHLEMGPPGPVVVRHFIEHVRDLTGMIYGRRLYEIMRYWEEDLPDWDEEERAFAAVWRSTPKWVVSRSLKSVGPKAIEDDFEAVTRRLKAQSTVRIASGGVRGIVAATTGRWRAFRHRLLNRKNFAALTSRSGKACRCALSHTLNSSLAQRIARISGCDSDIASESAGTVFIVCDDSFNHWGAAGSTYCALVSAGQGSSV